MAGVDRIVNELNELSDEGLADVAVAVISEIGTRGRTAGELAVTALKTAAADRDAMTDVEEGLAQLEPAFES